MSLSVDSKGLTISETRPIHHMRLLIVKRLLGLLVIKDSYLKLLLHYLLLL